MYILLKLIFFFLSVLNRKLKRNRNIIISLKNLNVSESNVHASQVTSDKKLCNIYLKCRDIVIQFCVLWQIPLLLFYTTVTLVFFSVLVAVTLGLFCLSRLFCSYWLHKVSLYLETTSLCQQLLMFCFHP